MESHRKKMLANRRLAKSLWLSQMDRRLLQQLDQISSEFDIRVDAGDLSLLSGKWYITHTGLLGIAKRRSCSGIHSRPLPRFCDPNLSRWAFRAVVFTSETCKGFEGYGDADPSNVSSLVRGAEMRIAETRAVNRALRKAYGIGICSVEELGSSSIPPEPAAPARKVVQPAVVINHSNGNGHLLRDRLLVVIRQHQLDPRLVKLYAADFCEVKELREATRDQVEEFLEHLVQYAVNDRDGLLCRLNSYSLPTEGAA